MAAAADPHGAPAPDPRAEERAAAQLEIGAELRELADRDDLLADDRRAWAESDAVLDDDARSDDERPSPRSTPSPICAPASRSAATFSAGASARNAS